MPFIDILRYTLTTLVSLFSSPKQIPGRSLRTEFFVRFLRMMLLESKDHSIPWLRKRQRLLKLRSPEQKEVVFEDGVIQGVSCQWCRPIGIQKPKLIVVYFHGGGYVVGDVDGYQNFLSQLAVNSDAWIVAVNYRLAPEFRFPAAHNDCLVVSQFILDQYPSTSVILAGDSAGGGLAVATTLSLKPNDISGLLLISPWLEPTNESVSIFSNTTSDIFDHELLLSWIKSYMGEDNVKNSQVDFTQTELSTLPNVYIQAANHELFIDQIKDFTERLRQCGVEVQLDAFDNQFHVFQIFTPLLTGSKIAVRQLADFISRIENKSQ